MIANALSARRLVLFCVVVVVVAVAAVAQAAGGWTSAKSRATTAPARAAAAPAPRARPRGSAARLVAAQPVVAAPVPLLCKPRGGRPPSPAARKPPTDALKESFGILRGDRQDNDALPARALAALKSAGLEPVDPDAARLLRADGAARAWVVPVPDVSLAGLFGCASATGGASEGLAVVSLGGAAAGGGGALRNLQRGQAPVAVDPCAGTGRDMLGVSGIVPDGVEAVFITAADGTATRADVHDNGYVFVLARPTRLAVRYVVWTGRDGAPHVQPLPPTGLAGSRVVCARKVVERPRVTPDGSQSGCTAFGVTPRVATPGVRIFGPLGRPPRAGRAARRRLRRVPAPARPPRTLRDPAPAAPGTLPPAAPALRPPRVPAGPLAGVAARAASALRAMVCAQAGLPAFVLPSGGGPPIAIVPPRSRRRGP